MRLTLVKAELQHRPVRTLAGAVSLAVGLALFLSLQAYADAYRQAARTPLSEIGTDIVAQREGDRPEQFTGIAFPHSTAPIRADELTKIRALPGVEAAAPALLFWSFQDNDLVVTLGLDPGNTNVGPGRLRAGLQQGRFLNAGDTSAAVLDSSYAAQRKLSVGAQIAVAGRPFQVVGLVDTSRAGQVANANVYLPLTTTQAMVAASKTVAAVHQIRPTDVNMVFVRAHPARSADVATSISTTLGQDALVTTPQTFDEVLGSTFGLIDRLGLLVGLAALLVAAAGLMRAVTANLNERRRDVAVLRAVGWSRRSVTTQLTCETAVTTALGLGLGIAAAAVTVWAMSQTTVTVPVPWELSPTPHFLAGGAKQLSVTVPMRASLGPLLIGAAALAGLAAAALVSARAAHRASGIKPTEVWRAG